MALKRPPQHRADAPIVYVHPRDKAWDHDRITREQAEMKQAGKDATKHPAAQYMGGHTRYDLDAELTYGNEVARPRAWLEETKLPTKWYFNRFTW